MAHLFDSTTSNSNLEIDTLLNRTSINDGEVHSIIHLPGHHNKLPSRSLDAPPNLEKENSGYPWWILESAGSKLQDRRSSDSSFEASTEVEDEDLQNIVVNGESIGDLPIEYTVEGLKFNEFPVIGRLTFCGS